MTEDVGDFAAEVDNDPALVSRASAVAEAEGISVVAAITKLAEAARVAAEYHDRPPVRVEWERRRRAGEPCDGHHLPDDCPCGRGWRCTCTCSLDNEVSLYGKRS